MTKSIKNLNFLLKFVSENGKILYKNQFLLKKEDKKLITISIKRSRILSLIMFKKKIN